MSDDPTRAQAREELLLQSSGASRTEAKRFGEMTRVENTVDKMHRPGFRLTDSPMHRLIWGPYPDLGRTFRGLVELQIPADIKLAIDQSEAVVRRHAIAGTLLGPDNKLSEDVLKQLADVGYFGLLVPRKYGGLGATARQFTYCEGRIAPWDYCAAILGSVHGAIGSITPLDRFGTEEQKAKYLPLLAGQWLSGFALTELGAGSDTSACLLKGKIVGDQVILGDGRHGKWFTTNLVEGSASRFPRLISVVAKIDGRFEVILFEVPKENSEQFRIEHYSGGLTALQGLHNNGSVFDGISVPVANILPTPEGTDGRVVALAALGFGRTSLAGLSTGAQRGLVANVGAWCRHRITFGKPIGERELVRVRVGKMAALLSMSEAVTSFAATRYNLGFQVELEAQLAKILTTEAVLASLEHFKNIHGGRSFSRNHRWSRFATEFAAMNVYEGANDLLGPNIIRGLLKQFSEQDVGPFMEEAKRRGLLREDGNFTWGAFAPKNWGLFYPLLSKVAGLFFGFKGSASSVHIESIHPSLMRYVNAALKGIDSFRRELLWFFGRNRTTLTQQQCRMNQLSQQYQQLLSVIITCSWASEQSHPALIVAAEISARSSFHFINSKKEDQEFWDRAATLGKLVIESGFPLTEGIEPDPIIFNYDN